MGDGSLGFLGLAGLVMSSLCGILIWPMKGLLKEWSNELISIDEVREETLINLLTTRFIQFQNNADGYCSYSEKKAYQTISKRSRIKF